MGLNSKRIQRISKWNSENTVSKSIRFNVNKVEDRKRLEYLDVVTQDMSFNAYIKKLIDEDGGLDGDIYR